MVKQNNELSDACQYFFYLRNFMAGEVRRSQSQNHKVKWGKEIVAHRPVCLITEERLKYVHIFIRIRNYHFLKLCCLMEGFWIFFFFFHPFRHRNYFSCIFLCLDFFFIYGKSCKRSCKVLYELKCFICKIKEPLFLVLILY